MLDIDISANSLVGSLLELSKDQQVSILDSCGVGHVGSRYMIAAIGPLEVLTFRDETQACLDYFDRVIRSDHAAIFTLSYDLGRRLQEIESVHDPTNEPLAFIARYRNVLIHDYDTKRTVLWGDTASTKEIEDLVRTSSRLEASPHSDASFTSNFSSSEYLETIESIKGEIRGGQTYQTNLTRRIDIELPKEWSPAEIFARLRHRHPSPFSAFIRREDSSVISASPERFFRIDGSRITTSPIKGTRPRGSSPAEDERQRNELLNSTKDRSENTMIVDLLRNDLGRVCRFGSVEVTSLCRIEEHPSLFHLVSTVEGQLRNEVKFSDVLLALFPCGSITGAPKLSTMKIIDRVERSARGLSMGAIGYYLPASFGIGEKIDLSVAIRTMVVEGDRATFNVGGGIVIDSVPENEWEETVTKSTALLDSVGIDVSCL